MLRTDSRTTPDAYNPKEGGGGWKGEARGGESYSFYSFKEKKEKKMEKGEASRAIDLIPFL